MQSILTHKENSATKVETISTQTIIDGYKRSFQIDVSKYFTKYDSIDIYECNETGFRFYYPLDLAGDGAFYADFQRFDWYYIADKWEHQQALNFIKEGDKLLEVGAAKGDFLKQVEEKGAVAEGLELNQKAIDDAKKIGITIYLENVETYSEKHPEEYDIVCSFQVLEHIADPYSFLDAQVKLLKKGGKLIFAVPNNDSFIKEIEGAYLNMPPHHMGLWDTNSIKNIEKIFPLKLTEIINEPLQDYHHRAYHNSQWAKHSKKYGKLARGVREIAWHLRKSSIAKQTENVVGHTIMACFEKK